MSTKIAAYLSLIEGKRIQPMEMRVVQAVSLWPDRGSTREELAGATGMSLSSVCGRVNSLIAKGVLKVTGTAKCKRTNKQQELIGYANQAES